MKVLMISYTSLIQELYHGKPREIAKIPGIDLTVLVPRYWKELWSGGRKNLEVTEGSGYKLVVGKTAFTGNLHIAFFIDNISRLLNELKPDVIDIENETFNAGSAQLVNLRNRLSPNSKIVMHASQSTFKSYPPPFNLFERYSLRNASAFLARNADATGVLRRKAYTGPVEVITHGVDPSQFAYDRSLARKTFGFEHEIVVGYVGALVHHKGLDMVIRATADLPCKLLLVGDGAQRDELMKLATELGMRNRIQILPPVPHGMIPRYLAAMDIFALPSRTVPNWREIFGRVLIEAMAAGIPVVGAESGEIPKVIGDSGLTFAEGDVESLKAKLLFLINSPNERERLSIMGRKRVQEKYSWEVIAGQTVDIYQKVTGLT